MSEDLGEILERLGLSQYHARLVEEGFEKWETVQDVTEQDLIALGFKIGHRRVLQREIASARGHDPQQSLQLYQWPSAEDGESEERTSPRTSRTEIGAQSNKGPTGKRKYRRHPKPDENAPERPPSAYVMFANKVRDELKGQSLSFTDIAKLVGERWKVLPAEIKEQYEQEASIAKERYNAELAKYKLTDQFKEYAQYLAEFKQKLANKEASSGEGAQPNKVQRTDSGSKDTSASAINLTRAASISSTGTSSSALVSSPMQALGPTSNMSLRQPISPMVLPSPAPSAQRGYRDTIMNSPYDSRDEPDNFSLSSVDDGRSHLGKLHTSSSGHIQQQLSFARERPPSHRQSIGSGYLPYSQAPTPLSRSDTFGTQSSSGQSTGHSLPSLAFDEAARSSRALPPPTPSIPANGTPGYFDNLAHSSRSPHPLSSSSHLLPSPTGSQVIHSSSYPPPPLSSASQLRQASLGTDSSSSSSGGTLPPSTYLTRQG